VQKEKQLNGEQRVRNWSMQCILLINVEFRLEALSFRFNEKYSSTIIVTKQILFFTILKVDKIDKSYKIM